MNNLKEPLRAEGWEFVLGVAVTVQNNLLNWIYIVLSKSAWSRF
jgi:hypothetical protein